MTQHRLMMKLLEPRKPQKPVRWEGFRRKQTERISAEQIAPPGAECSEEFVTEVGKNKKRCCDGADKDVLPHAMRGPGLSLDPTSKINTALPGGI